MAKNKLILTLGIPGSGKTTWTNEYMLIHKNFVRISRDYFRFMLKNSGTCEYHIENLITILERNAIHECLKKGYDVISDNTYLRMVEITSIIEEFDNISEIQFKIFDVSTKEAIERNENRERKVSPETIGRMKDRFHTVMKEFPFEKYKIIE